MKLMPGLAVIFMLIGISSCSPSHETPSMTSIIITKQTKTPQPLSIFTPTYTFTPTSINFRTPTPTQLGTPMPKIFHGKPEIYLVYEQDDGLFALDISGTTYALGRINNFTTIEPFPNGRLITFKDQGVIYTQDIVSKNIDSTFTPDGPRDGVWSGGWSADGKYLTYAIVDPAIINGTSIVPQEFPSIYIGNRTTGYSSRITFGKTIETSPSWSPDNQWVAFLSDEANPKDKTTTNNDHYGALDIYIMSTKCLPDIDLCRNSFIKQLTKVGTNGVIYAKSWNPDGTKIGYIYNNGLAENRDIWIVNLNGTVKNLTNTPQQNETNFSWSPDGKRIVFQREDEVNDLFILTLEDNTLQQITNSPNIAEYNPLWSPGGNIIAYHTSNPDRITYYSIKDNKFTSFNGGKYLNLRFWLVVFPEIKKDVVLAVSPSGENLNVRSQPSTSSPPVAKLKSGDEFTILEQPIDTNGYIWWKIRTQDNLEGWVVQFYGWYLPVTY